MFQRQTHSHDDTEQSSFCLPDLPPFFEASAIINECSSAERWNLIEAGKFSANTHQSSDAMMVLASSGVRADAFIFTAVFLLRWSISP